MEINTQELLAIEREAATNSFYEFFLSFWDILSQEELIDNWHIRYICGELQKIMPYLTNRLEKPYDLIFNVPPGSTKTSIVMQAFPAWVWAVDPTLRVISSSHSASLSIDSASKTRDILLSPRYKALFPHVVLRYDKSAKTSYENTMNGTRDVTSTGSSITGRHAHLKLMDDLQEISKAASLPHREQAIAHMKTLFTREVEKGKSINILIMQRLHELDATSYLLSLATTRRVRHICLPAEASSFIKPAECREMYKDGLLDVKRMSRRILQDKMVELGTYGYNSQFAQDPTPAEGTIIKRNWFRTMDRSLFTGENRSSHFFIDTAYEEKSKKLKKGEAANDPTGLLSCIFHDGVVYVTDYREVYLGITKLPQFIERWARSKGYTDRSVMYIEPKASGKSTVQMLRAYTSLNVAEIKGAKDSKETELTNSAPAIESGRFILMEGEWNRLFLDRVCGFPYAAHDEAVDLLCYARKKFLSSTSASSYNEIYERAKRLL